MPVRRDDPYLNFNFLVQIEGVEVAGFSEVELPPAEVHVVEYREGGDRQSAARQLPGRVSYGRLVLRRGFAGDATLFEWWQGVAEGAVDRRTVRIVLLDEARNPVATWQVRRAWPAKIEASELDALGNDVVIETLELAHEGLSLE
jgi:phage tail-like protein